MRILSFLFGLILIAAIVYCGYYSIEHPNFVAWFGVITAVISPVAFEFLLYPFRSKDKQMIKDLSKVPQIEKLLQEAKDNESKIELLEQQRKELDKLITYESKRRTLLAERALYITQGEEALAQIKKLDESLQLLTHEKQTLPDSLKELMGEIEKIESTDITYTLNGKTYTIRRKYFNWFPIYGNALFEIIKGGREIVNRHVPKK